MGTRKQRGRQSEGVVAQYLRDHGWRYAERVGAGASGSDITGTPSIDWEVKSRRALDLTGTLRQQAARAADGVIPVAVIRPDGAGPATVDRWPVVVPLAIMVDLLHAAGYGDPRDPAALADAMDRHPYARGLRAVDPVPRVVGPVMTGQPDMADSFRCACGNAALPISHSAARCVGPEAS